MGNEKDIKLLYRECAFVLTGSGMSDFRCTNYVLKVCDLIGPCRTCKTIIHCETSTNVQQQPAVSSFSSGYDAQQQSSESSTADVTATKVQPAVNSFFPEEEIANAVKQLTDFGSFAGDSTIEYIYSKVFPAMVPSFSELNNIAFMPSCVSVNYINFGFKITSQKYKDKLKKDILCLILSNASSTVPVTDKQTGYLRLRSSHFGALVIIRNSPNSFGFTALVGNSIYGCGQFETDEYHTKIKSFIEDIHGIGCNITVKNLKKYPQQPASSNACAYYSIYAILKIYKMVASEESLDLEDMINQFAFTINDIDEFRLQCQRLVQERPGVNEASPFWLDIIGGPAEGLDDQLSPADNEALLPATGNEQVGQQYEITSFLVEQPSDPPFAAVKEYIASICNFPTTHSSQFATLIASVPLFLESPEE
jgi:hypothetical protein